MAEKINSSALFKIQYGLFVITASDGSKDNGCIINTVAQITESPRRITVFLNKHSYTHKMIFDSGIFNISILTEELSFDTVKHFGFSSGKDTDKFADFVDIKRSENGLIYLTKETNAYLSAKVIDAYDYDTHTLFVAELTEAEIISDKPSVTYTYYQDNIKPQPNKKNAKGWECKVCGFVYSGEELPKDYICPICGHGADAFEPIK